MPDQNSRTTADKPIAGPTARGPRSPSVIALAVALPIAIIAGLIIFFSLHGRAASQDAAAKATATPRTLSTADNSPVTMATPQLTAAHAQMCLAFVSQIPTTTDKTGALYLDKLKERPVTGGPEQNVAFGDPAITAACGAPAATPGTTDEVFELNNVCWYEQDKPGATRWTTLDREVPVAVTIPNSYSPGGEYAILFSNAVEYAMPTLATPYQGCTQPVSPPSPAPSG